MNNKLVLPLPHKFLISTRRLKFVGNQNYQHSCLLAYDAVCVGPVVSTISKECSTFILFDPEDESTTIL
jgi:hypothetical protein